MISATGMIHVLTYVSAIGICGIPWAGTPWVGIPGDGTAGTDLHLAGVLAVMAGEVH